MTSAEKMVRYKRDSILICPKCDTFSRHEQRRIQYVPTTTQEVNGRVSLTLEFLAVYCYCCGYQLGRFLPVESEREEDSAT